MSKVILNIMEGADYAFNKRIASVDLLDDLPGISKNSIDKTVKMYVSFLNRLTWVVTAFLISIRSVECVYTYRITDFAMRNVLPEQLPENKQTRV